MKLYTKTGDTGETSLIGGRVSKSNIRVDAYGTVDTLNAHINVLISMSDEYNDDLVRISNYLFKIGHDLACVAGCENKVTESEVEWLEQRIDHYQEFLTEFEHFVLPGGTLLASNMHVARTITRTCERKLLHLNDIEKINASVLKYINRLSDFLYILSCYENHTKNKK